MSWKCDFNATKLSRMLHTVWMIEVMFRVWQTGGRCPSVFEWVCTPVNCEQSKSYLFTVRHCHRVSSEKCVAAFSIAHTHTHSLIDIDIPKKNKRELLSPVHYNRRIEWNCRHLCYISILITDEQHRTMDGSVLFMACPCHFNGMLHPIRPSIQSDRVNERAR